MNTHTISILGEEVELVEGHTYLGAHLHNRLDWKYTTEADSTFETKLRNRQCARQDVAYLLLTCCGKCKFNFRHLADAFVTKHISPCPHAVFSDGSTAQRHAPFDFCSPSTPTQVQVQSPVVGPGQGQTDLDQQPKGSSNPSSETASINTFSADSNILTLYCALCNHGKRLKQQNKYISRTVLSWNKLF